MIRVIDVARPHATFEGATGADTMQGETTR